MLRLNRLCHVTGVERRCRVKKIKGNRASCIYLLCSLLVFVTLLYSFLSSFFCPPPSVLPSPSCSSILAHTHTGTRTRLAGASIAFLVMTMPQPSEEDGRDMKDVAAVSTGGTEGHAAQARGEEPEIVEYDVARVEKVYRYVEFQMRGSPADKTENSTGGSFLVSKESKATLWKGTGPDWQLSGRSTSSARPSGPTLASPRP